MTVIRHPNFWNDCDILFICPFICYLIYFIFISYSHVFIHSLFLLNLLYLTYILFTSHISPLILFTLPIQNKIKPSPLNIKFLTISYKHCVPDKILAKTLFVHISFSSYLRLRPNVYWLNSIDTFAHISSLNCYDFDFKFTLISEFRSTRKYCVSCYSVRCCSFFLSLYSMYYIILFACYFGCFVSLFMYFIFRKESINVQIHYAKWFNQYLNLLCQVIVLFAIFFFRKIKILCLLTLHAS